MAEIVEGLRTYTQIDSSGATNLNLSEALENTIKINKIMFEESNVKLELNIIENIFFECEGGQINQVFSHLIKNACYSIKVKSSNSQNDFIGTIKIRIQKINETNQFLLKIMALELIRRSKAKYLIPFLLQNQLVLAKDWVYR